MPVSLDNVERGRLPMHTIGASVGFGPVLVSPPLMGTCAEHGITITHMTEEGRFLARVEGPVSGNVLLRRAQYRSADDAARMASIVKLIAAGKILNQRAMIFRAQRDHGATATPQTQQELAAATDRLGHVVRRREAPSDTDTDTLRGAEGEAANVYFGVFDHLVRGNELLFAFNGRSRRPPLDAVNAVLSFVYALLTSDARAALESVGLDPTSAISAQTAPAAPRRGLVGLHVARSHAGVDRNRR